MDKVLSARVDEAVLSRIGALAHRLRMSKKKVLENAIDLYASRVESEQQQDFLTETFGTWKRSKPAAQTVDKARRAFRRSMERHRR